MLHADPFHSYCVALVTASQSTLEEWASRQGISYSDFSELCRKEETVKEVQASLVKVCICIRSLITHNVLKLFEILECASFNDYSREACTTVNGTYIHVRGKEKTGKMHSFLYEFHICFDIL